jgi:hypothetical protein
MRLTYGDQWQHLSCSLTSRTLAALDSSTSFALELPNPEGKFRKTYSALILICSNLTASPEDEDTIANWTCKFVKAPSNRDLTPYGSLFTSKDNDPTDVRTEFLPGDRHGPALLQ